MKKQRAKLEPKPDDGHFRLKPELVFGDADKSLIEAEGDTSFFGGIGGIEKRTNEENELLESAPFDDVLSERTDYRGGKNAF